MILSIFISPIDWRNRYNEHRYIVRNYKSSVKAEGMFVEFIRDKSKRFIGKLQAWNAIMLHVQTYPSISRHISAHVATWLLLVSDIIARRVISRAESSCVCGGRLPPMNHENCIGRARSCRISFNPFIPRNGRGRLTCHYVPRALKATAIVRLELISSGQPTVKFA